MLMSGSDFYCKICKMKILLMKLTSYLSITMFECSKSVCSIPLIGHSDQCKTII